MRRDGDPDGRQLLATGDRLAREGDIVGAVEQYDRYCQHVETSHAAGDASNLRLVAVRRQILAMDPARRDVRRSLVENYVGLGLVGDAREQLQGLVAEYGALGDEIARDEAFERMRTLR